MLATYHDYARHCDSHLHTLARTNTTNTGVQGNSYVADRRNGLMEEVKRIPNRVLIQAGWAHAPHLSQDDIEDMKRSTPPHLIDSLMNGNPTMGA